MQGRPDLYSHEYTINYIPDSIFYRYLQLKDDTFEVVVFSYQRYNMSLRFSSFWTQEKRNLLGNKIVLFRIENSVG